ncbi:MAG: hypothetical protein AAF846_00375 [Chloroflexota bacterium]
MVSTPYQTNPHLANYTSIGSEGILFLDNSPFGHPKWDAVAATSHLLTIGCHNRTAFLPSLQTQFL